MFLLMQASYGPKGIRAYISLSLYLLPYFSPSHTQGLDILYLFGGQSPKHFPQFPLSFRSFILSPNFSLLSVIQECEKTEFSLLSFMQSSVELVVARPISWLPICWLPPIGCTSRPQTFLGTVSSVMSSLSKYKT